jgi:hypothetical protein
LPSWTPGGGRRLEELADPHDFNHKNFPVRGNIRDIIPLSLKRQREIAIHAPIVNMMEAEVFDTRSPEQPGEEEDLAVVTVFGLPVCFHVEKGNSGRG